MAACNVSIEQPSIFALSSGGIGTPSATRVAFDATARASCSALALLSSSIFSILAVSSAGTGMPSETSDALAAIACLR